MAITFARVQELVKGENINFYIAPDRPVVRFGIAGNFGRYDVLVHLQDDGQFLQFRTLTFLTCPANHPHLNAVLQTVAIINFRKRFVKYGWDSSDGEIVAYGDVWIMDNQITTEQFKRMMNNFIPGIDSAFQRLKATLDSGKDPGDQDPQVVLAQPTGGSGPPMPPQLKELLDKLQKKDGEKPGEGKPAEMSKGETKPEIKEI